MSALGRYFGFPYETKLQTLLYRLYPFLLLASDTLFWPRCLSSQFLLHRHHLHLRYRIRDCVTSAPSSRLGGKSRTSSNTCHTSIYCCDTFFSSLCTDGAGTRLAISYLDKFLLAFPANFVFFGVVSILKLFICEHSSPNSGLCRKSCTSPTSSLAPLWLERNYFTLIEGASTRVLPIDTNVPGDHGHSWKPIFSIFKAIPPKRQTSGH